MRRSIPKRAYTAEYREAAVRQVIDGGRGLADVARSLEISHKTLGNWVRLARAQKPLVKRELAPDPAAVELSRLRAENARLRMDNAIPKNRPRATSASHMHRNWRLHWRDARTVAVCFFGGVYPRQKTWPRGSRGPSCGGTWRDPV